MEETKKIKNPKKPEEKTIIIEYYDYGYTNFFAFLASIALANGLWWMWNLLILPMSVCKGWNAIQGQYTDHFFLFCQIFSGGIANTIGVIIIGAVTLVIIICLCTSIILIFTKTDYSQKLKIKGNEKVKIFGLDCGDKKCN